MLTYYNREMGFRVFYDSKCLVDAIAEPTESSLATVSDLWAQGTDLISMTNFHSLKASDISKREEPSRHWINNK